jgi:hypothetical protein
MVLPMSLRFGDRSIDHGGMAPSQAQVDLVRLVAERHGLGIPAVGCFDRVWARRFLACFAYDPETEVDVHRRLHLVEQCAREGRSVPDIAAKVELRPEDVALMLDLLARSGRVLDEVVEDAASDPEASVWDELDPEAAWS